MGVEKIKAALNKPWLKAVLMGAICASLIVSVYYSKDRWIALTAIGTIGAAFVALYISVNTKLEESRKRRIEAMIYIWTIHRSINKFRNFLNEAGHKNETGDLNAVSFLGEAAVYSEIIRGYDYPKLYVFDRWLCIYLNQLRNNMDSLLEGFNGPFLSRSDRESMLLQSLIIVDQVLGIIKSHDPSSYLPETNDSGTNAR